MLVRLVGFGMTGAGADDADRKRTGTAETTEVQDRHVLLGAGPALPCSGDSGGPVLVGSGADERIAGIRFRAWQPAQCLHPTIGVHAPLTLSLYDEFSGRGCD